MKSVEQASAESATVSNKVGSSRTLRWAATLTGIAAALFTASCAAPAGEGEGEADPTDDEPVVDVVEGTEALSARPSGAPTNVGGRPDRQPFKLTNINRSALAYASLYYVTDRDYCLIPEKAAFRDRAGALGLLSSSAWTPGGGRRWAGWCVNAKLPAINVQGAPDAVPFVRENDPYGSQAENNRRPLWYFSENQYCVFGTASSYPGYLTGAEVARVQKLATTTKKLRIALPPSYGSIIGMDLANKQKGRTNVGACRVSSVDELARFAL